MGTFSLFFSVVLGLLPLWELHLDATPRGVGQLITTTENKQILLIPLGNSGLGGWNETGIQLPGFPVSSDVGVILKPAAVLGSTGETLISYADDDGFVHLIELNGTEVYGWPLENSSNVITGITAIDIDKDGQFEISYGTSNGEVHLVDLTSQNIEGFPVDLQSQLQYQPTQISLGGGNANGIICATNNSKITILNSQGLALPGWPQVVGYPTGTPPLSGDINGDGQTDVLFATQDGKIHLYSLLGLEQEGWPFYMDDRPVIGSLAIGMLNSNIQMPQVAVASIDSTIYLIDGDGSLSGTWRWPNRTCSRPFQPIISFVDNTLSVIASSSNGSIYAWDAEGKKISEFPFENPGGVIFPPIIGDLNGDGSNELIVISPSGVVSAYYLSTNTSETCTWPLPLGNQYNSGCYGSGFLPVASVSQISGEFSGSIAIPYSIEGSNWTGISVSYSTDAGYTWEETRNFIDNRSSITWNTSEDLPSQDLSRCLVRITPYCSYGPGESGISGLLHIDNNRPPTIFIDSPEKIDDSRFKIGYAVEDNEGDIIQLQAQFSTDDGNTWNTLHLSGSSIEIESWFYGEPVTWNAVNDLGHIDTDDIQIRIRAADADPGPWYFIDGLHIDTDRLPSAQIIAPAEEVRNQITLGVRLNDPEQNLLDIAYQYSIDGGRTWKPATIIEAEQAGIERYDFEIIWESSTDLPGYDGYQVKIKALPSDMNSGIAVPSAPFHVDNNNVPTVVITSPSTYDVFRGLVPINFSVTDLESDDITLNLEYRLTGSEENWHLAKGLVSNGPFGLSRYNTMLNWNSSVDLPNVSRLDVDIRLVASDMDSVRSEMITPITLENTSIPEILRATIANLNTQSAQEEIAFEIADPDGRTIDLNIHYSIDGGKTWRQATISGNAIGLNPYSYSNSFIWHYGTDTMGTVGTVLLRITPSYQGDKLGRPRFIEQVFR